jgi:type II secretory pathway predicted ATPase ExeA
MDAAAANPSYRAHWNLREAPFASGLNPRYFFPSPVHDEALARLHFLVEHHQRLGLLLGGTGTGKSLVLDMLARDMRRVGGQVANISLLGVDLHEFMWLLAAELGLNPDRHCEVFSLWRAISDRLIENRYQQLDTVVLLDDADEARPEVLEHVARLAQVNRGDGWPLVVVVSVTADRVSRLGSRILELAELRIDLEPWEEVDTAGYLTATLAQAGCKAPIFTDDAVHRLQTVSGGIPRRVNQLAALALVAGAGRRLPRIDAETIESVYHELGQIEAVA